MIASLVDLGILRPGQDDAFSQSDVLRARWVHGLEEAGVPLDGMATAVRDGTLSFSYLDASAFDRFAEVSDTTFRQLSQSTGIDMDLLKVVREAVGFAEPRPEDRMDGEIADGAGELGFFPPYSWWPLWCAAALGGGVGRAGRAKDQHGFRIQQGGAHGFSSCRS